MKEEAQGKGREMGSTSGSASGLSPYYEDDAVTIYHADCRQVLPHLPVVDAIVTDPPYGREHLAAWDALGAVAVALKPAGWLLAYSGQAHLPEVLAALTLPEIAYRWTLSTRYEGGGQLASVGELAVLSEWKPVVAYRRRPFGSARGTKGQFAPGGRFEFRDLLRRGGRQKDAHPWAQPLGEAAQLIGAFSAPGDTILDPFMGSGTTLRAAKDLGCKAIGIEIEERYCDIAVKRLGQEVFDLEAA